MANADIISTYLTTKHLPPTQLWLQSHLPQVKPNQAPQAALQTAFFRIKLTDFTQSIAPSNSNTFPPNVTNPTVQELRLPGPIPVQVLDIEDIGRSRWSQVEAIAAVERGEMTKGREVIRVVPGETNDGEGGDAVGGITTSEGGGSRGPHKLLLQDAAGTNVYGIEMESIGVGVETTIGLKLLLQQVVVARGVVLLEQKSVVNLGGKVDSWDAKWREERKKGLQERAGMKDGEQV